MLRSLPLVYIGNRPDRDDTLNAFFVLEACFEHGVAHRGLAALPFHRLLLSARLSLQVSALGGWPIT
jgi:hypothetical protein